MLIGAGSMRPVLTIVFLNNGGVAAFIAVNITSLWNISIKRKGCLVKYVMYNAGIFRIAILQPQGVPLPLSHMTWDSGSGFLSDNLYRVKPG